MFDGRWRTGVDRATGPVGSVLRRIGVTADHLTALGLVFGAAAAVSIGSGRLGLGFALLVASAVPDLLDGPVAKAAGTAGPRGAFFDSVADRVTDAMVLGGVAWHLAADPGGRAPVLAFGVMAAASLVSYQRAKAESLGYQARGGLMERAERVLVLCAGLAFGLLVAALWVMLVLTLVTAAQRFVRVWRQAPVPVDTGRPERLWLRSRRVRGDGGGGGGGVGMEARWRAWRESTVGPLGDRGVAPTRRRRGERARPERSWRRRAGTRP
ncbi:MAG: CDP-alcohol phosphatidyltransferase family protein [Acidimicrobiales bacterium]